MRKIFWILFFLGMLLSACSIGIASPQPISPRVTETPAPSNPEQCGYQWANQALPELSDRFQKSIQEIQPEAQANAYAFGENCVRADRSVATFNAMETDFNVMLQTSDVTNEAELGAWIVKIMQVIENLPKGEIIGLQPGRVSITFRAGNDQKMINFYVNRYRALPSTLSTAEIYQALQAQQ